MANCKKWLSIKKNMILEGYTSVYSPLVNVAHQAFTCRSKDSYDDAHDVKKKKLTIITVVLPN